MMLDWEPLKQLIDTHQRFALSCHVRPDADALGSELALATILLELGKDVVIANPSNAPSTLEFLNENDLVQVLGEGIKEQDVLSAEVHLVLDTSAWNQLQGVGDLLRRTEAKKVVIDHHVSSDQLEAIEFKDTSAEATGSLIFRFAKATGLPISPRAAYFLFCAIATDTGWFRFPSATSQTYREIAELIDIGVQPSEVFQQLYERFTISRFHLSGRVLQRIETTCEGKVASTWVSLVDFRETNAKPVDTEDLVNECLKIEGTRIAFIAVEQQNGQVKFSFRARQGANVAAVAEQFGGGGHMLAAGAMLPGPLEKARETVLAAVSDALPS